MNHIRCSIGAFLVVIGLAIACLQVQLPPIVIAPGLVGSGLFIFLRGLDERNRCSHEEWDD